MFPKIKRTIQRPVENERGSLIILSYFVIVVLLGLGAAFMALSVNESSTAERQRISTVAFHVTEAGMERALYELRQDFVNGGTEPSWSDGFINGTEAGPDTANFYPLLEDINFGDGSYTVKLKNVSGSGDDVWACSEGAVEDVSRRLLTYVRMVDVSPWDYAIFAGSGASGTMVNGNVDIRGSVLILGDGLAPGDYAIDLGGTAEIVGNNYNGVPAELLAKVPALPTTVVNGETVDTLNAVLRVKKGRVGLSGSSAVGQPDQAGNTVKETVDAVYVTDGWGGNQGAAQVYSDNGTAAAYDLGDAVTFPSLGDPYPGYASYQDYLQNNALVLTTELSNIQPDSIIPEISSAHGSVSKTAGGPLVVSGIIYVDGNNNVAFNKQGSAKTINYEGKGSILVTGNVNINANLLTAGDDSFPVNNLGIMTPNNIVFNEAQINVMGVFYAEDNVIVQKQTNIMGTIVSNFFDVGTNVPAIFQVPAVKDNLPPGMIGADNRWYMVVAWLKSSQPCD
jgi:hypothetical protein